MKFRYIIVSSFIGEVFGTDNREVAMSYVATQEDFVIDTVTNRWIIDEGIEKEIKEIKL